VGVAAVVLACGKAVTVEAPRSGTRAIKALMLMDCMMVEFENGGGSVVGSFSDPAEKVRWFGLCFNYRFQQLERASSYIPFPTSIDLQGTAIPLPKGSRNTGLNTIRIKLRLIMRN
jgi:hypothetical protein